MYGIKTNERNPLRIRQMKNRDLRMLKEVYHGLKESEKEKNHTIKYTNLSVVRYLVETNPTGNPKRKQFDREILTALNEYTRMKQRYVSELGK